MNRKPKDRIFEILETAPAGDLPSRAFDIFLITLISLNVIAVILETVRSISSQFSHLFTIFEIFSVGVFTIEYLLRLWTCTSDPNFSSPIKGRTRFALTPLVLADLLAILPFYVPMVIPLDLRFVRAVRLLRLFRLFKMGRYSESLKTLGSVFKLKKEKLLITVFVVFILLVIASSLMYFVENGAQPESFSSIPAAMWWAVATLTTVGYGDVYPITPLGKLLGAIIALLGIGLFALPAGILASGLVEMIHSMRGGPKICPHCGKEID
jgi:voltage-gated potassium channel